VHCDSRTGRGLCTGSHDEILDLQFGDVSDNPGAIAGCDFWSRRGGVRFLGGLIGATGVPEHRDEQDDYQCD
jgi:hypothetical protein